MSSSRIARRPPSRGLRFPSLRPGYHIAYLVQSSLSIFAEFQCYQFYMRSLTTLITMRLSGYYFFDSVGKSRCREKRPLLPWAHAIRPFPRQKITGRSPRKKGYTTERLSAGATADGQWRGGPFHRHRRYRHVRARAALPEPGDSRQRLRYRALGDHGRPPAGGDSDCRGAAPPREHSAADNGGHPNERSSGQQSRSARGEEARACPLSLCRSARRHNAGVSEHRHCRRPREKHHHRARGPRPHPRGV